jgi:hypothetical protein
MKVISMHKVNAAMEAGALPDPELIQGMGRLIGEMRRSGVFVDAAGLRPSGTRVRLRFSGSGRTIERGPYAGSNERLAAVLQLTVGDMDEAIGWASRYAKAVGDVELELGPVTEAWDLGVIPKPAGVPLRCLLLQKADAAAEAGQPPSPQAITALTALFEEMRRGGVLQGAARLQPTRRGLRIKVASKKPTVMDGPFTESKELIAGFVILELASLDEARAWGLRFADVIGDVEMDLLPLDESDPSGSASPADR